MQPLDRINAYVGLVCERIRWKKARPQIEQEIKNHMFDQRDSYIAQGLDEEMATKKAIADTGDAFVIGMQLDRANRPKPQWAMFAIIGLLLISGLLIKSLIFGNVGAGLVVSFSVGVIVMFAVYFFGCSIIGKYPKTIYCSLMTISLAVLILSPIISDDSFFARNITLLCPLAFVSIILATKDKGHGGIVLCVLAFALHAGMAFIVPSIAGFLLNAVIGIILMSIAINKNWFGVKRASGLLLMFIPVILGIIVFLLTVSNYQWERLTVGFNPSLDPDGSGFMGIMARGILSSSKMFGASNIPQQYDMFLRIPTSMVQTDLTLTTVTAFWGWIASAAIVSVLIFFIVMGFRLCFKQKNSLGFFVSLPIMATFTFQIVIYLLFNLGIQVSAPFSLPFITVDSTLTVVNMGLLGLMLSVFRTGHITDKIRNQGG